MWVGIVSAVLRFLLTPFVWAWAGATWAGKRAADAALRRDRKADERREAIKRLPDADLDKRLRGSQR